MPKFTDDLMEKYCLIKSEIVAPCIVCKEITSYIEYCAEARFCSTECADKFYKELEEVYNK